MDDSNSSGSMTDKIFSDLDTSWIEKEQKLHAIDKSYCREPMHEIQIHIVYIDHVGSISNVRSDLYPCDSTTDKQYMSKERLLKIIQCSKQSDSKKYVLFEMMLFVVELDPQHIQDYLYTIDYGYTDNTPLNIYNGTPGGSLNRDLRATLPINELKGNPPSKLNLHRCKWCKVFTMVNDITIPPSIFIFHSTNGLFVFLKEIEVVEHKPLRSILRIYETDAKKNTKKVRISEHNSFAVVAKHKKTRKHHG